MSNKPSLVDVIKSVVASFFGVQSNDVRERDFQHGNPLHYIIVGIILTLLFILGVMFAVKLIMNFAGA